MRNGLRWAFSAAVVLACACGPALSPESEDPIDVTESELISLEKSRLIMVRFRDGEEVASWRGVRGAVGARKVAGLESLVSGLQTWLVPSNAGVEQVLALLRQNAAIAYAEENFVLSQDRIPDDPRFGELWGLHNTGQSSGRVDAVVARTPCT